MVRPVALLGLLLHCPFLLAGGAEERADYLIVPAPSRLPLYDQFQHRLTDKEKKSFPKGMAFRIIDARALLGDGIIPCIRVEFAGRAFYIERDAKSTAASIAHGSGGEIVEQAAVRSDTIIIRQGIDLTDPDGRRDRLSEDDRILLLMDSKDRSYVMTLDGTPRCGWVALRREDRGSVWVPAESARRTKLFSKEAVRGRIAPLVDRTNRLLVLLGKEMPNELGGSRPSPFFHLTTASGSLSVGLSDPSLASRFRGTLRALKARIQAELPGLPVDEDPVHGTLTVTGW
jgi:hypothetical protein